MGRWGRCDYRELKKLDERLQQLSEVDMDRLCRDAAKEIARILLNKAKKRTPVDTGALRDAWTILPIEKHGDQYTVTVINNLKYASYVEFGHRKIVRIRSGTDEDGNAIYGKKFVGYQKPRYMLTISEQEVKTLAPSILNDMLYEALKGVFS